MNHDNQWLGWSRFRTDPQNLERQVRALAGAIVEHVRAVRQDLSA